MNGIHSNWTQVQATDGSKMVINNWGLNSPPSYPPDEAPWQYKFVLNSGDYMVPVPPTFGDLTNQTRLAGQGEDTPVEKVFDLHFIVQVPVASGNQYFDPSYGVTYSSPADFEGQSVAGYAAQINGDVVGGTDYHFRAAVVPPYSVNISFYTNPSYSM